MTKDRKACTQHEEWLPRGCTDEALTNLDTSSPSLLPTLSTFGVFAAKDALGSDLIVQEMPYGKRHCSPVPGAGKSLVASLSLQKP